MDAVSLPVVDPARPGTLLVNPARSGKRNFALIVADLKRVALALRPAGLALVAARGEEHHRADENLTPGRDLSE